MNWSYQSINQTNYSNQSNQLTKSTNWKNQSNPLLNPNRFDQQINRLNQTMNHAHRSTTPSQPYYYTTPKIVANKKTLPAFPDSIPIILLHKNVWNQLTRWLILVAAIIKYTMFSPRCVQGIFAIGKYLYPSSPPAFPKTLHESRKGISFAPFLWWLFSKRDVHLYDKTRSWSKSACLFSLFLLLPQRAPLQQIYILSCLSPQHCLFSFENEKRN